MRPIFRRPTFLALLVAMFACSSPRQDASDPAGAGDLESLGSIDLPDAAAVCVLVKDRVAYVGAGEDGLFVVDVSEPTLPEIIGRLEGARCDALAFAEDHLVAIGTDGGWLGEGTSALTEIDVLDPRKPAAIQSTPLGQVVRGHTAQDGDLWAHCSDDGVWLKRGKRAELRLTAFPRQHRALGAIGSRGRAYVVASDPPAGWLDRRVPHVWLYAFDSATLELLGVADLGALDSPSCAIARDKDALWIALPSELIDVDTSNAKAPRRRAAVPMDRAVAIGADAGRVAIVTGRGTLELLDRDDAGTIRRAGSLAMKGELQDVALAGDVAFVAAGTGGLRVVRVAKAAGAH